jgi:hypothetical protein
MPLATVTPILGFAPVATQNPAEVKAAHAEPAHGQDLRAYFCLYYLNNPELIRTEPITD